ncbi:MAG: hypothetical protein JWP91_1652 [Fibrobacteres bacterium]|nr:hypothetical protein [Fibrobacterota bacterium]
MKNLGARIKGWWTGLFLVGMLAGAAPMETAGADFAPVLPGKEWVYAGAGDIEPTAIPPLRYGQEYRVRYKEKLRLRVMMRVVKKDTTIYTVLEHDSLFARVAHKWGYTRDSLIGSLPDTVALRTLTYKEFGGKFQLVNGDSLRFGHTDTTDVFFYAHATVSGRSSLLSGLSAPYIGMQSITQYMGPEWDDRKAWYLDRVGLYWAKVGVSCSDCGCTAGRELLLSTYQGMAVDPGIDPPGAGLAKEGRIACALARKTRPGLFRLAAMWGGDNKNLLGRTLPSSLGR